MNLPTAPAKPNQKLASYIKSAQQGSENAHLNLALIYCGELCLKPNATLTEDNKKTLEKALKEISAYGISPDYVKAYAHFTLSDTIKGGYEHYRKLLAEHMDAGDLKAARTYADEWATKTEEWKKLHK